MSSCSENQLHINGLDVHRPFIRAVGMMQAAGNTYQVSIHAFLLYLFKVHFKMLTTSLGIVLSLSVTIPRHALDAKECKIVTELDG